MGNLGACWAPRPTRSCFLLPSWEVGPATPHPQRSGWFSVESSDSVQGASRPGGSLGGQRADPALATRSRESNTPAASWSLLPNSQGTCLNLTQVRRLMFPKASGNPLTCGPPWGGRHSVLAGLRGVPSSTCFQRALWSTPLGQARPLSYFLSNGGGRPLPTPGIGLGIRERGG